MRKILGYQLGPWSYFRHGLLSRITHLLGRYAAKAAREDLSVSNRVCCVTVDLTRTVWGDYFGMRPVESRCVDL